MNIQESLNLSLYIKILRYNNKTNDEILQLKNEYINYLYGSVEPISEELNWFLNYLDNKNELQTVKEK